MCIIPRKCKNGQTGAQQGFDFYLENEEAMLGLCVVRCLRNWLALTGIETGYIFPKIYGHDQLQDSAEPIPKAEFLKNFRRALHEIGEPPELYTIHAFRRGGTQFLYQDRGFSLIEILLWGKWSIKLSSATILRYLIADTDIIRVPRDQLMLPRGLEKLSD